jgi:hypothetical protein
MVNFQCVLRELAARCTVSTVRAIEAGSVVIFAIADAAE